MLLDSDEASGFPIHLEGFSFFYIFPRQGVALRFESEKKKIVLLAGSNFPTLSWT